MQAFELMELVAQQATANSPWLEFLRVSDLSMGLYVLPAEAVDHQQPHTEDEVYYIARGRGIIRVGDEDRPVQPGSIVFVPANVQHQFHSITEALSILVFFAPAEYTRLQGG